MGKAAVYSGGIVLLVGASVVGLASLGFCVSRQDRSSEIKDKLLVAFEALADANDAATNHKKALAATATMLHSLEVPISEMRVGSGTNTNILLRLEVGSKGS